MRGDVSRVQAAEEPSSKGESEMGDVLSTLGVALTAAIALVLIQRFKHAPFFFFFFSLYIYIYIHTLSFYSRSSSQFSISGFHIDSSVILRGEGKRQELLVCVQDAAVLRLRPLPLVTYLEKLRVGRRPRCGVRTAAPSLIY